MRQSILIVDDEELERELLRQIFENDYNIIMAKDGKEAIVQLGKHLDEIAIVLLDLVMPVLNGYQVLQVLHSRDFFREIPVAVVTANSSPDLEVACYTMGAISVVNKPFKAQIIRKRIDNIIEMYQSSRNIKLTLTEQLKKTNLLYGNLIDSICSIAEFRQFESGIHIKRIKALTKIMAEEYMRLFPDSGLTEDGIELIVRASAVHDIGKIAIPDNILLKPGVLTDDEWQIMMSHTTKGCEILSTLADQGDAQFKEFYNVCRSHHERYDGSGYPDGLVGDEIPLSAQLVSIVHAYETLIGKRVYKQQLGKDAAFKKIMTGELGAFSPRLLQCFKSAREKLEMSAAETQ